MLPFNVNEVDGKWIIGSNNKTTSRDGLTNWGTLGSILDIPSVINGHRIDEIGNYAFSNSKEIENIVIGNGIKQINHYSFNYCINLKSVIIPSSVEFIGKAAINCYNLSADILYGQSSRECTSQGTVVVTILPESKLSYVNTMFVSRIENIVIYYFGKKHVSYASNPYGESVITSIKVYSPYVSRFVGLRTLGYRPTQYQKRRINHTLFVMIFLVL